MFILQEEAFQELKHRLDSGDMSYKNAALIMDGMSIKELVELDPHLNRMFGVSIALIN